MDNQKKIEEQYAERKSIYERLSEKTVGLISIIMKDKGISVHSITERVKDKDSLLKKVERKNDKYSDINEITDVVGIRIITFYSDEVDKIAEIIRDEFDVDDENTIDKRKTLAPDVFGYLSLHYIVKYKLERTKLSEYKDFKDIKMEIQIRTILQHTWAEIEHDMGYKSTVGIPSNVRRDFSRLAGLLELADKEFLDIRKRTEEYKKEVPEAIENNMSEVLIDVISLRSYVETSKSIARFFEEVEEFPKSFTIEEADDAYLQHMTEYLNAVGIMYISDIEKAIDEEFELCIFISKKLHRNSELPMGLVLVDLFYAKLLKENDTDNLRECLAGFAFPKSLAGQLLSIYKQFQAR